MPHSYGYYITVLSVLSACYLMPLTSSAVSSIDKMAHQTVQPFTHLSTEQEAVQHPPHLSSEQEAGQPPPHLSSEQEAILPPPHLSSEQEAVQPPHHLRSEQEAVQPPPHLSIEQEAVQPPPHLSTEQEAVQPPPHLSSQQEAVQPPPHPSIEQETVQILNSSSLPIFIASPDVRLVYFYGAEKSQYGFFMRDYHHFAEILIAYEVTCGKVNCGVVGPTVGHCNKHPLADDTVYFYKNSEELIGLHVDHFFDKNSIVSNVLQFVLLKEVLITQTFPDVDAHLKEAVSRMNVMLTYQKAIGTYDHRVLMEAVYMLRHENYRFLLTTEKEALGALKADLNDSSTSAFWVFRCIDSVVDQKEAVAKMQEVGGAKTEEMVGARTADMGGADSTERTGELEYCHAVLYEGTMTKSAIYRFLRAHMPKSVHDLSSEDAPIPPQFDQFLMHTAVVFFEKGPQMGKTKEMVKKLAMRYYGFVGFVLIPTDQLQPQDSSMMSSCQFYPCLAVRLLLQSSFHYLDRDEDPEIFLDFLIGNRTAFLARFDESSEDADEPKRDGVLFESVHGTDSDSIDDPISLMAADLKMAAAAASESDWMPPALTSSTFVESVLRSSSRALVLFHLPFDAKSVVLLHLFANASKTLASVSHAVNHDDDVIMARRPPPLLATVDCYDWMDVCANQNVTRHPSLYLFSGNEGFPPRHYEGVLSENGIVGFAIMLQFDVPLMLTTTTEANTYMEGLYPKAAATLYDTSILALLDESDERASTIFKEIAHLMIGKSLTAILYGSAAKEIASQHEMSVPGLVVMKRNDVVRPMTVFGAKDLFMTPRLLLGTLYDVILPSFPTLTPNNFPTFYAKKKPFLILFHGSDNQQHREAIHGLIRMNPIGKPMWFIPCYINVSAIDSYGSRILHLYDSTASLPTLALVDHMKGVLYIYGNALESSSILQWLDDIFSGAIQPTKSLLAKDWAPIHPGIDFLAKIDEREKYKREDEHRSREKQREKYEKDAEEVDGFRLSSKTLSKHEYESSSNSMPEQAKMESGVHTSVNLQVSDEEKNEQMYRIKNEL